MDSTKKRILVVEDDPSVLATLKGIAEQIPCTFEFSQDPEAGLKLALNEPFTAIILDIKFPHHSGLDICREIRTKNKTVPILMLTSLATEIDKIVGLELGADDYVTKPFSPNELTARVRALVRRAANRETAADVTALSRPELVFGPLRIAPSQRRIWMDTREIELSALEFDLLFYLASRPGIVCSREELTENVWGYKASEFDATITAQLSRLRAKIEPNKAAPTFILTVKGVGYRFRDA